MFDPCQPESVAPQALDVNVGPPSERSKLKNTMQTGAELVSKDVEVI
jgi:hypothetical protein